MGFLQCLQKPAAGPNREAHQADSSRHPFLSSYLSLSLLSVNFVSRPFHSSGCYSPACHRGFEPGSGHVVFVDIVELGQVYSKYFDFPCHSFHRLLHTYHHPLSAPGTTGQTVAEVPSGFSLTLPQET
jgi:hypothetical protein